MKKILVPYFSQTGQLKRIIDSFLIPFSSSNQYDIDFIELKLKKPFPFPWNAMDFFDAMPECVNEIPAELELFNFRHTNYDLIILPYQPWFLSPPIHITSFLKHKEVEDIIKDTPIVTLIGCRNMWVMAHEKLKKQFADIEGKLVGNIALVDRASNLKSVITILMWMFYNKKGNSGVSDEDIKRCSVLGELVRESLESDTFDSLQVKLLEEKCLEIKPNLLLLEQRGSKAFKVYANFIAAKGGAGAESRKLRVKTLLFILPPMIFILSPIMTIMTWFFLVFKKKQIEQQIVNYSLV